ncbi:unnamed protein product [Schistocephalus solidus]|uniref:Uncharacterized protein n=1 Tax=Schistocephalus solidus TaxID=70667 RepID=A0A183SLL7_SCHSO|nr:unnamed protein product [Schistocephalus solidus]
MATNTFCSTPATSDHLPPSTTTTTTRGTSKVDSLLTYPFCDRTFTSTIGLIGDLRIYRTETGKPVPGAPTYTRRTRINCPQSPRTFTHRMGLLGHMCLYENLW